MEALPETRQPSESVSVAVVAICSAAHVARCLDALRKQQRAPDFDVVVVYDPKIQDVPELQRSHPDVRFLANEGQRTPLELASTAIGAARGDLILLTEDHCIPQPDWVRSMADAQADGRAVVGGRVEIADGASATDWAFYFVDFFKYADPVEEGRSRSLTVCNASYRREHVDQIREIWQTYFHETAINDALRERFGDLWLEPRSAVTMGRHVTLGDAIYERYAFGRLFACTRLGFVTPAQRLFYTVLSPALPLILMWRMARKALGAPKLRMPFLRSLVPLTLMVLWWSWGEFLGYVTLRNPRSLVVAAEIRAGTSG